jgi:arsenite methyltransferase
MKPLYLAEPVRAGLGPCLRPGGLTLTKRILELVAPSREAMVLDGGCGSGATLDLLHDYGLRNAFGCDIDASLLDEAKKHCPRLFHADLHSLPLANGCLDLVLCECVWNLTERTAVAGEFYRVLRADGYLAITDIHLRAAGKARWPMPSCFAGASDLALTSAIFEKAGFTVEVVEDHSSLLTHTTAEFIFAHGSLHGFWQAVLGDRTLAAAACSAARASRPGLFLLLARRSRHERL